jgi:hypothetical protein
VRQAARRAEHLDGASLAVVLDRLSHLLALPLFADAQPVNAPAPPFGEDFQRVHDVAQAVGNGEYGWRAQ